jgi:hypothetical protein
MVHLGPALEKELHRFEVGLMIACINDGSETAGQHSTRTYTGTCKQWTSGSRRQTANQLNPFILSPHHGACACQDPALLAPARGQEVHVRLCGEDLAKQSRRALHPAGTDLFSRGERHIEMDTRVVKGRIDRRTP